jgi:A repeated domain in UCH-protein
MPPFVDDNKRPPGQLDVNTPLLPSPGRLSSRLLQDILQHANGDSEIYTTPPHFNPLEAHGIAEACHIHAFKMKHPESLTLRSWNQYLGDSYLILVCEGCKTGATITGTLSSDSGPKCGTKESSKETHHFHLENWTTSTRLTGDQDISVKPEKGTFGCCQCSFVLDLEISQRLVPEDFINAIETRFSPPLPHTRIKDTKTSISVANAYITLSTYITHVLNGGPDLLPRKISTATDSPFDKRIGATPESLRFMKFLGWELGQDEFLFPTAWDDELALGRLRRNILEHAEIELLLLANDAASHVPRLELVGYIPSVVRADSAAAKLLGVFGIQVNGCAHVGYEPRPDWSDFFNDSRTINLYLAPHFFSPFRSYICLGTTPNADDITLVHAYTKQIEDDPVNADFYLECLQDLSLAKQSRLLREHVERELARGLHSRFELKRAYQKLEIDSPATVDDDGLFAVFHSRCSEVPERELEFKRALDVIHYFRVRDSRNRGAEKKGMFPVRR